MRKYNKWAGNPKGNSENPEKCVVSVHDNFLSYQCSRKRGFGPEGEYCKQHAKLLETGKNLYVPRKE